MDATRKQARIAGALYLLLAISAPFGLLYVPSAVIVSGNAAETANHLRGAETLVRIGIASELFHQTVAIFLVLALYRLFKPVNDALAQQLVILGALVSVPIVFVNVLNEVAALSLASRAEFLSAFDTRQQDALAYLFLRLHSQGIMVAAIFWGLWLFPFGLLVIRSRYIPPTLGVLLMLAGAGYLANSFTSLIVPRYASLVQPLAGILQFGELPIILWLAIWGARARG